MESGDNPAVGCIIFLVFIIFSSIFYGFGSALQHINAGDVEKKAEEGDRKSVLLLKMISAPADLINTIQLVTILLGFLTGFFLISGFSDMTWKILAVVLGLVLFLTLGILAPKKLCAYHAWKSAYQLLPVVRAVIILLLPVSRLTAILANGVIRMCGVDPAHLCDDVTEDEIIDLVDEAHEQGVIQESEAEMIQNIMEFGDTSAKDIMTHRKNMNVLEDTSTLEEAVSFMAEHNNSRYPVYHEDIDNIIGFIHIKDAMLHQLQNEFSSTMVTQIPNLIRNVAFIPETRSIDSIFKAMQTKKVHMAIVVDEYGQTAGLLTLEDILEEIVGNILDEYDESEEFIQPQMDQSILMDGLTPLEDAEEVLGIELGECEYETLNGYLTSLLEHIPTAEDKEINANGYRFQILSVERNIIQKLRVEKIQ